jgi:hypothetical protein
MNGKTQTTMLDWRYDTGDAGLVAAFHLSCLLVDHHQEESRQLLGNKVEYCLGQREFRVDFSHHNHLYSILAIIFYWL